MYLVNLSNPTAYLRTTMFNLQKFYTFLTLRLCVFLNDFRKKLRFHTLKILFYVTELESVFARYALSPIHKQTHFFVIGLN